MLIDKEDETQSELEVEEQKAEPTSELPEFYRDKSFEDVVKMHQDQIKMIGRQSHEVGEVRKLLADELIKHNLSFKQQPTQQEVKPEIDFFENPEKAVRQTIDNHPDVLEARQAGQEFRKMQIQHKLAQNHPSFEQIVHDQDFLNWVKSSPVRIGLYAKADAQFDYDSANELLSTYKELRGVKTKQIETQGETQRKTNLRAAQVDAGGSGESGQKIYRSADLIKLKMTEPDRYDALSDEILKAYSEGRVR